MSDAVSSTGGSAPSSMSEADRRIVDLFVDGVRVIGLPKSIGEIYGLLFVSRDPLSLDDLVARLGISKGSASQGLRMWALRPNRDRRSSTNSLTLWFFFGQTRS